MLRQKIKQKEPHDGAAFLNPVIREGFSRLGRDLNRVGKQSHAFSSPGRASSGSQPLTLLPEPGSWTRRGQKWGQTSKSQRRRQGFPGATAPAEGRPSTHRERLDWHPQQPGGPTSVADVPTDSSHSGSAAVRHVNPG